MTREEYMSKLREQLEKFGNELKQEILEDYSQHFAEGEAEGRSDEEIIRELGNIEDMIRELRTVETEAFQEEGGANGAQRETAAHGAAQDGGDKEQDIPEENDDGMGAEQLAESNDGAFTGDIKGVVLKSGVADIVLVQSDDDAVHVDYRNDGSVEEQKKYEFYQYMKDNIFYAGVRKNKNYSDGKQRSFTIGPTTISFRNNFNIGARNENIVLIARVPRKVPEVKMESSSGNIEISKLALGRIKGVTASGDVTVLESVLEKMEFTTASGDINVNDSTVERMEFTTASGDIDIAGTKSCSARFVTASGDVGCRDMISEKIDVTTASGDVNLKADAGQYHLVTASGDVNLRTEADSEKLEASTVSGDVNLSFGAEGAEVKVSSRSGDISLNYKGHKMEAKSGMVYTFGDGSCKVSAHSVSGDVAIAL